MTSDPSPDGAVAVEALSRWHAAVNAGDVEAAVACCADDVAIAGPRGVGHGRDLVRAWLVRSGIRLDPQHELIERDGRFVVHEVARWTTATAPDGAPLEPTSTWCVFTVDGGRLTSVARYATEAEVPA